jgi:hypothetical protein
MPIPLSCPFCRAWLDVPGDVAGYVVKCSHCKGQLKVPTTTRRFEDCGPVVVASAPPEVDTTAPWRITVLLIGAFVLLAGVVLWLAFGS